MGLGLSITLKDGGNRPALGFLLAVSVPLAQQNHDAIMHETITATLAQSVSVDPPVGSDSVIERSEQG